MEIFHLLEGYMLADAGYDVWLGNARGTEPSRAHVRLHPNGFGQKKFWSFSWHEIGIYDLPAIIDHILSKTKQKKINYLGYSQGSTAFLVLASERPEYNDKLMDVHLMAPVGNLFNLRNKLLKTAANFYKPLKKLAKIIRLYKFTIDNRILANFFELVCKRENPNDPTICRFALDAVLGSNYVNMVR